MQIQEVRKKKLHCLRTCSSDYGISPKPFILSIKKKKRCSASTPKTETNAVVSQRKATLDRKQAQSSNKIADGNVQASRIQLL